MKHIFPRLAGALALLPCALLPLALAGCGGGGGSFGGGGGTSSTALTGKAAVQAAVVSGYQAFQGGANYPFAQVQATLPNGSPLKAALRTALAAARAKRAVPHTGPTSDGIGLYSAITTSGNTATITLYTDAAETHSEGALTITQTAPAVTNIQLGTYTSYPVAFTITANVTTGPLPITGSGTITLTDSAGAGEIKGSFTLPASHVIASANLTLSDSGAIGGTATVMENGQTLTLTGLTGTIDGTITGSVTVAPQGYTGTATLSILNVSFSLVLNTPQGTATGSLGTGGLTITFPDGSQETLISPLTTAPAAPVTNTTFTLSGTVLDGSGGAAAGDTVVFDGNSALSAVTNGQGQFTLTVPSSAVTGSDTLTVFSSQGVLLQTQSVTTGAPVIITLPTVPTPPTNL